MKINELPWVLLDEHLETHPDAFFWPVVICRLANGQLTCRGIQQDMPESTWSGSVTLVYDKCEGEHRLVAVDPDDMLRLHPEDGWRKAEFEDQVIKVNYDRNDPVSVECLSKKHPLCAGCDGHCRCDA